MPADSTEALQGVRGEEWGGNQTSWILYLHRLLWTAAKDEEGAEGEGVLFWRNGQE